jgi:hypothetical protein
MRPWAPGSGVGAVHRPWRNRPRTATDQPTDGAEKATDGPVGAVAPTVPNQIPTLTCHFRILAVALVTEAFFGVSGAEGLGDALAGDEHLAIGAVRRPWESCRHTHRGPVGPCRGHTSVLPGPRTGFLAADLALGKERYPLQPVLVY